MDLRHPMAVEAERAATERANRTGKEVGATIAFVRPRKGAATALEIAFPGAGS